VPLVVDAAGFEERLGEISWAEQMRNREDKETLRPCKGPVIQSDEPAQRIASPTSTLGAMFSSLKKALIFGGSIAVVASGARAQRFLTLAQRPYCARLLLGFGRPFVRFQTCEQQCRANESNQYQSQRLGHHQNHRTK
jgi:hypothetical protein